MPLSIEHNRRAKVDRTGRKTYAAKDGEFLLLTLILPRCLGVGSFLLLVQPSTTRQVFSAISFILPSKALLLRFIQVLLLL